MERKNNVRERIAYLAARLIAEDGIDDFSQAKRKAANQIRVADTHSLPSNAEIEEALRVFNGLFKADEHRGILRALRRNALKVMKLLEKFNPYLTGSVLSGTAGKYSDINIHLFTDSAKDVEFFFLNSRLPYRPGEIRKDLLPVFSLDLDGVTANITVYPSVSLRERGERAKISQVEALLSEE